MRDRHGTLARVAMDAAASGDPFTGRERWQRTAKSCGPGAATVASSWRADPAGDGGKKRRSPGRARISRKTIARGKPGCPGCTCSLKPVCFLSLLSHMGLRAQSAPGFPCALCQREGHKFALLRRNSRCENESACPDVRADQFSRRRRRLRSRPAIRAAPAQIRQPACSPVARP